MTDVEIIEALSVCIEELMTLLRRTREAEKAEEIYAAMYGGDSASRKHKPIIPREEADCHD